MVDLPWLGRALWSHRRRCFAQRHRDLVLTFWLVASLPGDLEPFSPPRDAARLALRSVLTLPARLHLEQADTDPLVAHFDSAREAWTGQTGYEDHPE